MTEVNTENTLELEDLAPKRMPVKLPSGDTTPMLDPKELSLYDRARIGRMSQRLVDLNDGLLKKDPSREATDQQEKLLRELTREILPEAPDDVIANMAPFHLDQVVGAFLGLYGDMTMRVAKTIQDRMETTTQGS